MIKHVFLRGLALLVAVCCQWWAVGAVLCGAEPLPPPPSIIHKVQTANERMEMTVNTSRILSLDQKIPQAQVNNPEILEVTPLSPTEIQVSAKAPGVTQINLWGEDKRLFTVDVVVYADAQALKFLLKSQFPQDSLKVVPVSNGVLISGFVDRPDDVSLIVRIAEEYYPKVINAISVGGVQQVLLHVKVMEVSRTKLRRLGFDWAKITGNNVVASGASGLLGASTAGASTAITNVAGAAGPGGNFVFNVVNGTSSFFGVLDALREDGLAKIKAEPTLVTVSGRPAHFNSGGEFPVPVPQSLGTLSIEYKRYGTMLDFVPIALGNGRIRLEVRPYVSEIDESRSITIQGTTVPGLRSREAETGVELDAGQTLAIAGMIYYRTESLVHGLPWISEMPYLGAAFRTVHEQSNEIELLIMVTPELVDAMDACQVPPCGPGMHSTVPNDWELFMKGYPEVPNCCPNCNGAGCSQCNGTGSAAGGQTAPPPGMIGPVEAIQAPQPGDSSRWRPRAGGSTSAAVPARARTSASPALGAASATDRAATPDNPAAPQNQYAPSRAKGNAANATAGPQNSVPGFIGPSGYDVLN